jgi:hypothetical protein
MLRTLFILLVAANIGVFAWSNGWLDPLVPAPGVAEREPARLGAQVNAAAVKVLTPVAASDAIGSAARAAAPRCVELGPFGLVDATAAEAVLEAAGLPAGTWERDLRGPAQVWLRVPRADAAMREKLQSLAASSSLLSGGFRACAPS